MIPINASKLWLKGGHLHCPQNGWKGAADLLVTEGQISAIFNGLDQAAQKPPEDALVMDVSGLWLAPGLVDFATHMRSPGNEEEERLDETLQSAAFGGVTTVVGLPTTYPTVETGEDVSHRLWRAEKAHSVALCVVGALSKGREGHDLADIAEMAGAGAVAFSDVDTPTAHLSLFQNACRYASGFNKMIIGGQPILGFGHEGQIASGGIATRLGLKGIPEEAEYLAITRDLEIARLTGAHIHLGFISAARSLKALNHAIEEGLSVSAAVSPWHLTFTEQVHLESRYDTSLKFRPPLRQESDRQALIEGVTSGKLLIASGHRPVPPQEKEVEFSQATPGAISLPTYLSLLYDTVKKGALGNMTYEDIIKMGALRPAQQLGLTDRGHLSPGARADISLFCPQTTWRPNMKNLPGSLHNTPIEEQDLTGQIQATLTVNGWAYTHPSFEKRVA
jgi:dihydroorotase